MFSKDLAGPFKKSDDGNEYIAIAVDAFSKYVEGKGNIFSLFHKGIKYILFLGHDSNLTLHPLELKSSY